MSLELLQRYLSSDYKSAKTGQALSVKSAQSYVSWLRTLGSELGLSVEKMAPAELRALAKTRTEAARDLTKAERTRVYDTASALRACADYIELGARPATLKATSSGTQTYEHNAYAQRLERLGFSEDSRTSKILGLSRERLTIYVKRETDQMPIIIHPSFDVVYSTLIGLPGVNRQPHLSFYHNSNLTKFPLRDNGFGSINYGIAFDVATADALLKFVETLENAQSIEVAPDQTLADTLDEPATEISVLGKARIGQGRFRADLLAYWRGCCPITSISAPEMLRASHIKPWSESNNNERLDPFNGVLLAVHLDALFDSGLITFDDAGEMMVSEKLSSHDRAALGIFPPRKALPLDPRHLSFMRHHRQKHRAQHQDT